MTQTEPAPGTTARDAERVGAAARLARTVTRAVDPQNVIVGVLVFFGALRHHWSGVGWGLLAALFAGVIPQGLITLGMRRGRVEDRYVGDRSKRSVVLPLVALSVVAGLVLMLVLGAPRDLSAMLVAMLATLVPILGITAGLRWKVSIHAAVTAGAVAMLALALSAWWWCGLAVVAVVSWSRVVLRDHTAAQTVVGALVGAVTAGLVFSWAR
jgi:membrane-associated phospholipid phosphatase